MVKALSSVVVVIMLAAGAFWFSNPELAKKTFDENKANVEKMVDDLKKKAE